MRGTRVRARRHILEQWDEYKPKFRKVMPVEYRRAIEELIARGGAPSLAAAEDGKTPARFGPDGIGSAGATWASTQ